MLMAATAAASFGFGLPGTAALGAAAAVLVAAVLVAAVLVAAVLPVALDPPVFPEAELPLAPRLPLAPELPPAPLTPPAAMGASKRVETPVKRFSAMGPLCFLRG